MNITRFNYRWLLRYRSLDYDQIIIMSWVVVPKIFILFIAYENIECNWIFYIVVSNKVLFPLSLTRFYCEV